MLVYKRKFHTEFVSTFTISLLTKLHMLNSNGSLATDIKLIAIYTFPTATTLFYIP